MTTTEQPTGAEQEDCLFCRIVAGDVPSAPVLDEDTTYAFRDINPGAPTHVLVVPKQHIVDAAAINNEHGSVLVDLFRTAQHVAEAEGLSERGYRLVFNVGPDSGNTVPHLHLHVMGGRFMTWPPG